MTVIRSLSLLLLLASSSELLGQDVYIVNAFNGRCVEVKESEEDYSHYLSLGTCRDAPEQKWSFIRNGTAWNIRNKAANRFFGCSYPAVRPTRFSQGGGLRWAGKKGAQGLHLENLDCPYDDFGSKSGLLQASSDIQKPMELSLTEQREDLKNSWLLLDSGPKSDTWSRTREKFKMISPYLYEGKSFVTLHQYLEKKDAVAGLVDVGGRLLTTSYSTFINKVVRPVNLPDGSVARYDSLSFRPLPEFQDRQRHKVDIFLQKPDVKMYPRGTRFSFSFDYQVAESLPRIFYVTLTEYSLKNHQYLGSVDTIREVRSQPGNWYTLTENVFYQKERNDSVVVLSIEWEGEPTDEDETQISGLKVLADF